MGHFADLRQINIMSHFVDLGQVKIICIIKNYKTILIYFGLQIQYAYKFLDSILATIDLSQIMLQIFLIFKVQDQIFKVQERSIYITTFHKMSKVLNKRQLSAVTVCAICTTSLISEVFN